MSEPSSIFGNPISSDTMIFLLGAAFYAKMSEKHNSPQILNDIREHCKRSCTAEHCNNCALRKYTEEK